MRANLQRFVFFVVVVSAGAYFAADVDARPSMGRVGGGGGRPGGGMSRPSAPRPNMSRPSMPNMSRPSMPNMSRPSMPNASRPSGGRPSTPSRPSMGNFNPSGGRPNFSGGMNRPSLPGSSGRPSADFGEFKPVTRPSMPSFGGGGGVGAGGRPEFGRPGTGAGGIGSGGVGSGNLGRPGVGGGSNLGRPGITERPSLGGLNRPSTLPADLGRPGSGLGRPGVGEGRPGAGIGRPGIGEGRPGIGGNRPGQGGNRPIIGGGNNINIGDNINIGSGNIGNSRPGWGLGGGQGNWGDHWHDNCINNHYHNWYNGCWHGHYGYGYNPYMWGAIGYGLGSWWSYPMWGYGNSYYNPYYSSGGSGYDYSQPVVVNNYVTSNSDSTGGAGGTAQGGVGQGGTAQGGTAQAQAQDSPETQKTNALFDQALADFKAQNYIQASTKLESALRIMPQDPVLHEVRALCMFALGRYSEAAAGLNALLATAPGMDWTSMSNLYGDTEIYTQQLRKLESHIKSNPTDGAAIFVLAYHYLVIGEDAKAVDALKHVVKLQPKDATAQRMLASLAPPASSADSLPTPPPTGDSEAPQTDLVGRWTAKSGDSTIELSIDEQSQFTWKASPTGKPAIELKGKVTASSDMMILESEKQGSMVGRVTSKGADRFQFVLQGAPPGDAGLDFQRAK